MNISGPARAASSVGAMAGCIVSLLLTLGTAGAIEGGKAEVPGADGMAGGTVITSEKLYFDQEQSCLVMEENVHVVGTNVSIDADILTVRFRPDNQITNIVAAGHVRIVQGEGVATCATARCDVVRGEMVLTGNPEVIQAGRMMSGEIMVIQQDPVRKTVRVHCEGNTRTVLPRGSKLDDMRLISDKKTRPSPR
ncbi:MAG: LptA/OstA family protein [bacterium]